jgi:hypothetical protein
VTQCTKQEKDIEVKRFTNDIKLKKAEEITAFQILGCIFKFRNDVLAPISTSCNILIPNLLPKGKRNKGIVLSLR